MNTADVVMPPIDTTAGNGCINSVITAIMTNV